MKKLMILSLAISGFCFVAFNGAYAQMADQLTPPFTNFYQLTPAVTAPEAAGQAATNQTATDQNKKAPEVMAPDKMAPKMPKD